MPPSTQLCHDARRTAPTLALVPALALALATPTLAVYPDLQLGGDRRISHMGLAGETAADGIEATDSAAVYNATDHEFLVAWSGSDDLVTGREIYIRRVDADTGSTIGGETRISNTGASGNLTREATHPAIAWDSQRNRYLVVWCADDQSADDEREIYGQLIDADGSEAGVDDFRVTETGAAGDADAKAEYPAVLYDPEIDQFLVVWLASGDGVEIRAQHVSASFPLVIAYAPSLVTDFAQRDPWEPLSSTPDIVYNSVHDEYLVVWSVTTQDVPDTLGYQAIYAQRLASSTLARIGIFDRQISDHGQDGTLHLFPQVAFDPFEDRYFIVWYRTWIPFATLFEPEVYGELRTGLSAGPIGAGTDQRLSEVGQDDSWHYSAFLARVAFDPVAREYLVVFEADHDVDDEYQIRGLLFDQDAQRKSITPASGQQLSHMSGIGAGYDGFRPALAAGGGRFLVTWEGDADTLDTGNGDEEFEIFAQPTLAPGLLFADGFESGGLCNGPWVAYPAQCLAP